MSPRWTHAAFASEPASSPRVRLRLAASQVQKQVQDHFRPENVQMSDLLAAHLRCARIELHHRVRVAEGEELGSNLLHLLERRLR
jgi:hypothetical protein